MAVFHYADGQPVKLGDRVRLDADSSGVIVALIDTSEFSEGYLLSEWEYLKSGILVHFDKLGLIHYAKPEVDLELITHA